MQPGGVVVRSASRTYAVNAPQDGWAESHPADWLEAIAAASREVVRGARVDAIGLSGQMHGVVLTNSSGAALRPALLWSDTRSAAQLSDYRSLEAGLLERLGNPVVAGMMGANKLPATGMPMRMTRPSHACPLAAFTNSAKMAKRMPIPPG